MFSDEQEFEDDEKQDFDSTDGPSLLASTLSSSYTIEQAQEYIVKLESAIQNGNVQVATEMAERLASIQAPVRVKADARSLEDYISITVNVVDKSEEQQTVVWKLQPSISIHALKWKMFERFGYSPNIQNWIIGNRLANDGNSLADCGVSTNGSTVFLYLLTPATTGKRSSGHDELNGTGDYSRQLSDANQMVSSSSSQSDERLQTRLSQSASNSNLPPQHASPECLKTPPSLATSTTGRQPVGWQCPGCTFVNEPTRPGCEQCTTDRPAGYQLPADYKPSERERRRLETEKNYEELIAAQSRQTLAPLPHLEDTLEGRIHNTLFGEHFRSLDDSLIGILGQEISLTDEELAYQIHQQELMLAGHSLSSSDSVEIDYSYNRRRH